MRIVSVIKSKLTLAKNVVAIIFAIIFLFSKNSYAEKIRQPAQFNKSCSELVEDILNGYKPDLVERYFLGHPNTESGVGYQLNFERVQKWVLNLPHKHRNQIFLSSLGKYDAEDIHRIDIPGWGSGEKKKLILSAGVHGNESAGVVTIINLLENILYDSNIRNHFDIVVLPYLNPGGLKKNARRVNNGVDLNRSFPGGKSEEQKITKFVRDNLKGEKFDLAIDLHEAPFRDKFFAIKMFENDNDLTKSSLADIDEKYLITSNDGVYPGLMYKAQKPGEREVEQTAHNVVYELHGPGEVSSFNRGTVKSFFHYDLGANHSYTLEAPGQMELREKIEIYTKIVSNYLNNFLTLK